MRVVIQRVKEASCTIDKVVTGKIDKGYMILVGFGPNDNQLIVEKMIKKIINLRIFEDENGKMNYNLAQVNGSILSISQFTLYANCNEGNRPSFVGAMKPAEATLLYDYFNNQLRALKVNVQIGIFGADMQISLINDGPVTIVLEF